MSTNNVPTNRVSSRERAAQQTPRDRKIFRGGIVLIAVLAVLADIGAVVAFAEGERNLGFSAVSFLVTLSLIGSILLIRFRPRVLGPSPQPSLSDGETIEWTAWANHIQHRDPREGGLTLTTQRLVFVPTKAEVAIGAVPAQWPRESIVKVAVEGVDGVDTHGIAGKLIVTFMRTAPQWFQLGDAESACREITAALASDQH